MTLAEMQSSFIAHLLDEEAPCPHGLGTPHQAGFAVYRGNYRAAVVESLQETYAKTCQWTGEEAFRAAAIHHVKSHPSASWTIDHAGAGFDATCAQLFTREGEVAELAWLEWAMLEAFGAPDTPALSPAQFAAQTAAMSEAELIAMKIRFTPDFAWRMAQHNLTLMWRWLEEHAGSHPRGSLKPSPTLSQPRGVLVWREGERPTFKLVERAQIDAIEALAEGATFGETCTALHSTSAVDGAQHKGIEQGGAMLGQWVKEGLVAGLNP